MEIPVTGMVLCVIALLYRIWLQGHQRDQREHQQLLEQQTKPPKQDKQKEIQNQLYELSIQLSDLDERIGQDDQFEAAAKEFIDLHGKLDSDLLSHKKYDTLEFKELAIKTGKSFERLVANPKLKILIGETEEKDKALSELFRENRIPTKRFGALTKKEKELVLKRAEENLEDEQERIKMAEAQERIKEELEAKRRKWERLDQIEAEED